MVRRVGAIGLLLTACGADGPPSKTRQHGEISWSVDSGRLTAVAGGPRPGVLGIAAGASEPTPHWRAGKGGPAVSWRLGSSGGMIRQKSAARVELVGDDRWLRLTTADGRAWTYGPLMAFDVYGNDVPVRFVEDSAGWAVRVSAVPEGPITVDPVLRTASFSAAFTADSAAGIGDVDGDGYDDVAAGAVGGTTTVPGQVTVWHGAPSGPDPLTTASPTPASASWQYGRSLSGGGDLDNDGYSDLVVGDDHRAWVHYGAATGLGGRTARVDDPNGGGASFGYSVAIAGDLDGDGVDDLVVGDPGWSSSQGAVHWFAGGSSGVSSSASETRTGDSAGDWFGVAVAGAGDVDADGYADLIVGAHAWNGITGRAYVFHGYSSGLSASADTTLSGIDPLDNFGRAVDGAGDVDQDGYDDVVIGAFNGGSAFGSVAVHHGSATGVSAAATTTVVGPAYGSKFGQSVAALGDVDGDGYPDVAMGGHGTTTQAGVHHGSASGVSSSAVPALQGGVTLGKIVDGAGDVNGDGLADLLVVDPGAGTIDLHFGGLDLDGDGWISPEDCDDADTGIRGGATVYDDLDGDGFGDPATERVTCTPASGQVPVGGDCDDLDAAVNPHALELPGDRLDGNCDGLELCFVDADGDGVLSDLAETTEVPAEELGLDCAAWGYFGEHGPWGDCDDADPTVRPGIDELCNGEDTDCDGVVDSPAPPSAPEWAPDADGDGVPAEGPLVQACESPEGHVRASSRTDCDDSDPGSYPGASEHPGDGIDQDCDGVDAPAEEPDRDTGEAAPIDSPESKPKTGCAAVSSAGSAALGVVLLALVFRRTGASAESPETRCGPARCPP